MKHPTTATSWRQINETHSFGDEPKRAGIATRLQRSRKPVSHPRMVGREYWPVVEGLYQAGVTRGCFNHTIVVLPGSAGHPSANGVVHHQSPPIDPQAYTPLHQNGHTHGWIPRYEHIPKGFLSLSYSCLLRYGPCGAQDSLGDSKETWIHSSVTTSAICERTTIYGCTKLRNVPSHSRGHESLGGGGTAMSGRTATRRPLLSRRSEVVADTPPRGGGQHPAPGGWRIILNSLAIYLLTGRSYP